MNDRFRRLLLTLGPVIGALILIWLVNLAVDTYSAGVDELRTERRATATAEAGSAITGTTTLTGTTSVTGTAPVTGTTPATDTTTATDTVTATDTTTGTVMEPNSLDATEAITSILAPSVTESINLDAALSETVTVTGSEEITATEAVTE